jgi:acyl-coenzyme A synthetase/AMP-(fatty) acid ligase
VCTAYEIDRSDLLRRETPVPIGTACEGTEVFALDASGALVQAPGVEGELFVRGPSVALGYWDDPELTAERFPQYPLHARFRDAVFRTRDRVMLDPQGNWVFLGRTDTQVKSRGYRVEPGELEATLYRHPAVREAAVVTVPDERLGARLIAFVVATEPAGCEGADLRAFCAAMLPPHMLPSEVRLTETLPRTSTGKINRPALVATLA